MSLPDNADDESDGVMLGVLAVPSWMTPSDFLAFVAPAVDGIGHLRIIRQVRVHSVALTRLLTASFFGRVQRFCAKPLNSHYQVFEPGGCS